MKAYMTIHKSWDNFFNKCKQQSYYQEIQLFLENEKNNNKQIFPSEENIFAAFSTNLKDIKVVVIGQDPYHNIGQAHGFSFSVLPGVKPPPSLKNIYKEIEQEFNFKMNSTNGYLMPWVEQGVFLLNTSLTVEAHTPASHAKIGWEIFTKEALEFLIQENNKMVFLLWGSHAQKYETLLDKTDNLILKSAHPSPFSAHRGFLGNEHFKKANEYLKANNIQDINWQIL